MFKRFGKAPHGTRLEKIKNSPQYKDGKFHNLKPTPMLAEGATYASVIYDFLRSKNTRRRPATAIPAVKTDLHALPHTGEYLVWFGHSSYFMQIDGKRILVDPVLSGSASPIKGLNKSFKGSDQYHAKDVPAVDFLFLTHDHYDHADYDTLVELRPKVGTVVCGLGVGSHLEYWGYDAKNIHEKDWGETLELGNGFTVHTTPARHFSGRGFSRNNTLWVSFVLTTPTIKIFIGGDGGYDTHFKEIGDMYGPFDLVILEDGQYNKSWKYIHLLPEEVLEAAKDLRGKRLLPVHSGKFMMSNHAWDEPLQKITELCRKEGMPVLTPMIGERVDLKDENQTFREWWKGVE